MLLCRLRSFTKAAPHSARARVGCVSEKTLQSWSNDGSVRERNASTEADACSGEALPRQRKEDGKHRVVTSRPALVAI